MIFDAFKLVIWLIERYDLQDKVRDRLDEHTGSPEAEAVRVDTYKPYVITFREEFLTKDQLVNEIVDATNNKLDQTND